MPRKHPDPGLPPWKRAAAEPQKPEPQPDIGGFVVGLVADLPLRMRPKKPQDTDTDDDYDVFSH